MCDWELLHIFFFNLILVDLQNGDFFLHIYVEMGEGSRYGREKLKMGEGSRYFQSQSLAAASIFFCFHIFVEMRGKGSRHGGENAEHDRRERERVVTTQNVMAPNMREKLILAWIWKEEEQRAKYKKDINVKLITN